MVDTKSYELAEHFLSGFEPVHPDYVMELAQTIQDAVEDWIASGERNGILVEKE